MPAAIRPEDLPAVPGGVVADDAALIIDDGAGVWRATPEQVLGGSITPILGGNDGASLIGSDDDASGTLWTTIAGYITYLRSSAGSSVLGFLQAGTNAIARTLQDKVRETVSVADFAGLVNDGTADDTIAFQRAHDALSGGGIILVPKSSNDYRVSRVDVTNPGVTFRLEPGATIKKYGTAGPTERGIFWLEGLHNADFVLEGGTIDLNGQGAYGIREAGRIANAYGAGTIPQITGITGPANAAVFARRSSFVAVRGCTIKNTSESAVLMRNCGDWEVSGCTFDNIANWCVEISLTSAAGDGGSGPIPSRDNVLVENNIATRCNDLLMGSGNGGAIGGGGEPGAVIAFRNYRFNYNSVTSSYRGIQVEFPNADSYLLGLECIGNNFYEISQNCITFIGISAFNIANNRGHNIGHPAPFALTYQRMDDGGASDPEYPDIAPVIVSSLFSTGTISNFEQTDDRSDGVIYRTNGVTVADDATVTSSGASFDSGDIGKPIAILGAGPSGAVHETTIASINSPTSIELTVAPFTSVASNAKFAYGGACRNGLIAYAGDDVDVTGCTFVAGTTMGLTNEPEGSAIQIEDIGVRIRLDGNTLIAPSNGGTTPAGIRVLNPFGYFTGNVILPNTNTITGFTRTLVGTHTYKAFVTPPTKSYAEDRPVAMGSPTTNFGDVEPLNPDTAFFSDVIRGSVQAGGTFDAGGETVTFRLRANFFDEVDGPAVDISFTAPGTQQLTAKHLKALNPDGERMRALSVQRKSSIAGSVTTGFVNITARQM